MGLFSHKSARTLGIDLGTSSMKAVELALVNGAPRLVNYVYAENVGNVLQARDAVSKQQVAYVLRSMLDQTKITTKYASTALPNFSVFSAVMSVPALKKQEELDAAIRWEAKKFVPMPLDEMNLKWEPVPLAAAAAPSQAGVGASAEPASHIEVLITAAPRSVLTHFIDIFALAKLQLTAIETESLALTRSLMGKDPTVVMVIDIGAISSDISVIEQAIPVISRSIDVGGQTITKVIHEHMNIDEKRAEQFKRDIGMAVAGEEQAGLRRLIDTTFQSVVNEIRYSLDLYQQRGKGAVQRIILTGGSAYLAGMTDYLAEAVKLPVFIGDAWQFVSYPQDLKSMLNELGPRFSVAIGLALRELV